MVVGRESSRCFFPICFHAAFLTPSFNASSSATHFLSADFPVQPCFSPMSSATSASCASLLVCCDKSFIPSYFPSSAALVSPCSTSHSVANRFTSVLVYSQHFFFPLLGLSCGSLCLPCVSLPSMSCPFLRHEDEAISCGLYSLRPRVVF